MLGPPFGEVSLIPTTASAGSPRPPNTNVGNLSYAHDLNANRASDNTGADTYKAANQLTASPGVSSWSYDGNGNVSNNSAGASLTYNAKLPWRSFPRSCWLSAHGLVRDYLRFRVFYDFSTFPGGCPLIVRGWQGGRRTAVWAVPTAIPSPGCGHTRKVMERTEAPSGRGERQRFPS